MVVLMSFKNEEDPIKSEGARAFSTFYISFSDAQGQITGVGGGIWPKFELIQALVQIIFYFWSFEIMEYILRTQKLPYV